MLKYFQTSIVKLIIKLNNDRQRLNDVAKSDERKVIRLICLKYYYVFISMSTIKILGLISDTKVSRVSIL